MLGILVFLRMDQNMFLPFIAILRVQMGNLSRVKLILRIILLILMGNWLFYLIDSINELQVDEWRW